MKKASIIVVIIVIIIVVAGIFLIKKYYQPNSSNVPFQLDLSVNTTLAWTDAKKAQYEQVKEALAKNPNNFDALFNLAGIKQSLLDTEGAIKIYNQLRILKPQDIRPLQNLGTIYVDTKQYESAEEMELAILAITPKWLNAYRELISLYQFHLKDKGAKLEPLLLRAYEISPELKMDMTSLLALYYDVVLNNREKAVEYYQQAVQLDPRNTGAKDRLAELKKID